MKKMKKQKADLKYKHRKNVDNLSKKSVISNFFPFDMDFIWEYPANSIFRAINEKHNKKLISKKIKLKKAKNEKLN